jgi:hypothetical protein
MPAALVLLAAVAAGPPANLLLVTIDTLRADHLHAYGYAIDTAATDGLARAGVVVEDATVQAPQTRPSHASLLTGRYPYEHRIRDNFSPPLDPSTPTLATLLRARGYDTAAFIGSIVLAASSGLDRGFAVYDDPFSAPNASAAQGEERRGEDVVSSALAWLGKQRTGPFFAWVHLYDPHAPYEPPERYRKRYPGRPYDGEVAYADAQLGRLLDFLERQGLQGRTLVVVTSDHGEGLGDHGEEEHMMFLYDSTLHVPLLLSWPGVLPAGARVKGQLRSIDVMPTVLDLLGVPALPVTGVSRAASLRAASRIADSESYAGLYEHPLRLRAAAPCGPRGGSTSSPARRAVRRARIPGAKGASSASDASGGARAAEAARLRYGAGQPAPVLPADAGTMERMAALGRRRLLRARGGAAGPKDKVAEFRPSRAAPGKACASSRPATTTGHRGLAPLARGEILSMEVQLARA